VSKKENLGRDMSSLVVVDAGITSEIKVIQQEIKKRIL
jgi:hypothetical protein